MNRLELSCAVRLTAAAFAVFMTMTMLDGMADLAEPQHAHLQARNGEPVRAAADAPQRIAAATPLAAPSH